MSSKFETGHAINVANFSQLVSLIPTMGIPYAPPVDIMEISELNNTLTLAEDALRSVSAAAGLFNAKSDERELLFREMPLRATKVINILKATRAPKATIKEAQAISKKIRGKRADASTTAADPDPSAGGTDPTTDPVGDTAPSAKRISVSQRSYDQQAQHFRKLVDLAAAYPRYTPSETDMTVTGLYDHADTLTGINKEMDELGGNLFAFRYQRDQLLYATETGIYDLTISVKNYIRTITGHDDPRYKQIAKIRFTNPKRR